eukprot:CAMPEP_0116950984 /NCGR_PEP_ID=MMETSP0467-20121206/39824_1 /TAXON_ID=283647 /ORGANISM="Mesodinium pulex, Strain SPMC105" /LENGTH=49 /DNA_ID=CAMNT_0004635893 /DNA_START=2369 /DNA_END=2518 /DNA_ORIENTATION=-
MTEVTILYMDTIDLNAEDKFEDEKEDEDENEDENEDNNIAVNENKQNNG